MTRYLRIWLSIFIYSIHSTPNQYLMFACSVLLWTPVLNYNNHYLIDCNSFFFIYVTRYKHYKYLGRKKIKYVQQKSIKINFLSTLVTLGREEVK